MGKKSLWNWMAKDPRIRKYLPPTELLTLRSLQTYLDKHSVVYIKPDYGQGGWDIIKAWRTGNKYAYIADKGTPRYCESIAMLYGKVKRPKPQVIQKGIARPRIKNRPIDFRLLMVKDQNRKWQHGGMIARTAGDGWIITNKRSHGKILTVETALRRSLGLNQQEISSLKNEMFQLGNQISSHYNSDRFLQLGIDIAVDTTGKLWLIETNCQPGWSMFSKLSDKSMLRGINTIVRSRRNKWSKA